MNDNDLKKAFRALAEQDARSASPFSWVRVESLRSALRAGRRRVLFTASGLTFAAATVVMTAVMPRQELLELDLSNTGWVATTVFLLDTPGSSLLRSVPSIGSIPAPGLPDAFPARLDTSPRNHQ
jgi:hypothetical protein